MLSIQPAPRIELQTPEDIPFEVRLERGEIIYFPACPFPLPGPQDLDFLRQQRPASPGSKHIAYDDQCTSVGGLAQVDDTPVSRLANLLKGFRGQACAWLSKFLPRYAPQWHPADTILRPMEEATHRVRFALRDDLLHLDSFPNGPANGRRLLRLFVNFNSSEPRVWATSDGLGRLLERFGAGAGLLEPNTFSLARQLRARVLGLWDPAQRNRTSSDEALIRFGSYLKADDLFQERGPRHFWHFAPGSAWLAMTDGLSHAVLRGQYALEQTLLCASTSLACPQLSPAALLVQFQRGAARSQAA